MLTQCTRAMLYRLAQEWGMVWDETLPAEYRPRVEAAPPSRYRCYKCGGCAPTADGHAPGECRRLFHPHILGVV
jgi:hypothetical protein